jgi:hypothetical protein
MSGKHAIEINNSPTDSSLFRMLSAIDLFQGNDIWSTDG